MMKRKTKNILLISCLFLIAFLAVWWISNSMNDLGHSKPHGSYISSASIDVAKRDKVFLAEYDVMQRTNFSANKLESYTLGQIWIEQNTNDISNFPETSNARYILTVLFDNITENDLHEFRLTEHDIFSDQLSDQRQHPDAYPRVRFLLNNTPDTLLLEVIERNPQDSIAWLNEQVIDTLLIIKGK